jgi:Acetyltransferase (GNAT) domain
MSVSGTITTALLVLRPVRREDGPTLLTLIDNWNVAQWLGTVPWPYAARDMDEFLETIALPRAGGPKPIYAIVREGQPIGLIECGGIPAGEWQVTGEVPLERTSAIGSASLTGARAL